MVDGWLAIDSEGPSSEGWPHAPIQLDYWIFFFFNQIRLLRLPSSSPSPPTPQPQPAWPQTKENMSGPAY